MSSPILTRAILSRQALQSLHRARNWSKADVSLLEWPTNSERNVVIKDLRRCPMWFRSLAGRFFLRREWTALKTLREIDGAPRAVSRIDIDAIAMTRCDGRQIVEWQDGTLPVEVLNQLESLLQDVHRRGVTHGDLHGDNILVDESGAVSLIDWTTACVFSPSPRGFKRWTFDEWRALDERALAKLKMRHAPHLLSQREHEILRNGGSRVYRGVKKLRRVREFLSGKKRAQMPRASLD